MKRLIAATALVVVLSGCALKPSLFGVSDKTADNFASVVRETMRTAPPPIVMGPSPEKVVDWPELLALAGLVLGSVAKSYYFYRKRSAATAT